MISEYCAIISAWALITLNNRRLKGYLSVVELVTANHVVQTAINCD